jgi:thiamine-monophosphate kinase
LVRGTEVRIWDPCRSANVRRTEAGGAADGGKGAGVRVSELGEFGLIRRIAARLPDYREDVRAAVGDDVAVLALDPGTCGLATCDIQVEGVHFSRELITPFQLGRRAAAVNLSDIAAKGGIPEHLLVSLALPPDLEVSWVDGLYAGLAEEGSRHGVDIVGGNLSRTEGPIVVDVFLMGKVSVEEVIFRSGARPGDVVLVTGWLGEAAVGLSLLRGGPGDVREGWRHLLEAYLTPTPRVKEGRSVAASRHATAMIDLSDGLSSDVGHICEQSWVGVRLFADRLPISGAVRDVAEVTGREGWALALEGGEDYELCLTVPAAAEEEVAAQVREETGTQLTCVGEILKQEAGRWVVLPDGSEVPLRPGGWNHFARDPRLAMR